MSTQLLGVNQAITASVQEQTDFESLMLFFEQLLFDLLFQLKRQLSSLKSKYC